MFNFNYYTPTKVIFGKGSENQTGLLVKKQNCKKVLIHYGGKSAVKSGLIDRIKASLQQEGIAYTELGGVRPNPKLSLIRKGIELSKKEGVDFILAVGGGSVIDSSKAIGYGMLYDGDIWDLFSKEVEEVRCMPIGVVLTISAAGSEMSKSCVIVNDEKDSIKRGYGNDCCRPVFSIMNPELTMTLSDWQTACGCSDILMHTMDRYFTSGGNMEITDSIAEVVMRTVIKNALILKENPADYDARAEIMWSGSLSHNDLTGCGNDGGDHVPHILEQELSGEYDTTHGAGLASVWGSWARYVYKDCLHRFYRFAVNVHDVEDKGSREEVALKGIEKMEEFYRAINMPTSIHELGLNLTDEELVHMASMCSDAIGGEFGSAKVLHEEDFLAIYRNAR